jgi:hypothetical protein
MILPALVAGCGATRLGATRPELGLRRTACELLGDPEGYDRRIVTVRGRIRAGFQDSLLVDADCGAESRVWLEWADDLPDESWGEYAVVSSGQEWVDFLAGQRTDYAWRPWRPRPAVELSRDASFDELNRFLSARSPQILFRAGRSFYDVQATITGRFDHLPGTIILRNAAGERGLQVGFGSMNRWMDRIVVVAVADVRATRVAE